MFTGIITATTKVLQNQANAEGRQLTFARPNNWSDLAAGESVATDGVCLTVEAVDADSYRCQLVPETLQRTTFGRAVPTEVNLERPVAAGERFGGHFVQGHVDDVGHVVAVEKDGEVRLSVKFAQKYQPLVIEKGSIAINGVSLTVATVQTNVLTVALIPFTLSHTTLGSLKPDDGVNLEFDMLAKYILKASRADRHHR